MHMNLTPSRIRVRIRIQILFPSLLFAASLASAQPAIQPTRKTTVIERGSSHYAFERVRLHAPLVARDYRLHIMRPRQAPPPEGYPVIFLLDGNAAVEAIDEDVLARMAVDSPPLIVAIGPDSALRFDLDGRTYDYTPPASGIQTDAGEFETQPPHRRTGGADRFLDFIETTVRPAVAQHAAVDWQRQGVWGHSYGGLFVLHALLARPGQFRCHIAASPSLWWRQGQLLTQAEERLKYPASPPFDLLLTRGTNEAEAKPPGEDSAVRRRWQERQSVPPDALPRLAKRMKRQPGARVHFLELPGLSHGAALAASLEPALHWFKACSARSDTPPRANPLPTH